jgi:DUF1680 family protein
MIRLADFLLRWTGDLTYADFIERNIYNGILAQQHPITGMIAYFLPLEAGGKKLWGSPTYDFWCCHGTLVQAHASHNAHVYYEDEAGIVVCQYIPTILNTERNGSKVTIQQQTGLHSRGSASNNGAAAGDQHRPDCWKVMLKISAENPSEFALKIRLPWWLSDNSTVSVDGASLSPEQTSSGFVSINRVWTQNIITLELPKCLTTCALPDAPEMCAFLDGPVVLAGLCNEERMLVGDKEDPASILTPDNEREWGNWLPGYRTRNQSQGVRFKPLYTITDEAYTVYFPVCASS